MPRLRDLTGYKFGRLTVVERVENKNGHVMWRCSCECGNEKITRADALLTSRTQSCGCFNREQSAKVHTKHGESKIRLHHIWRKIRSRCSDTNNSRYMDYGGRGIRVCSDWDSYETFRQWALENGYRDDLTIDRIDVDGNYDPTNCRWITNQEQQNNRRDNHYITYNGEKHTITEWARIYGLSENALVHRVQRGWDIERALHTPIASKSGKRK